MLVIITPKLLWINKGEPAGLQQYARLSLPAMRTVEIPSLCWGAIPHSGRLQWPNEDKSDTAVALMVPMGGVAMERGLLIETGLVLIDQDLVTRVFNLRDKRARIKKGDVISQVVIL